MLDQQNKQKNGLGQFARMARTLICLYFMHEVDKMQISQAHIKRETKQLTNNYINKLHSSIAQLLNAKILPPRHLHKFFHYYCPTKVNNKSQSLNLYKRK